jgi:hypothetical protein
MRKNYSAAFAFAISFLVPFNGFPNAFYVAPNGSSSSNGSINTPWDLQTALNQPVSVQPGDTLFLRGGTYAGFFTSNLNGTNGQYIYVLQYPGEFAQIADNRQYASGATLQVNGSWTIYKNFEITNTNTNRTSSGPNSFRPMGLQVQAPHTKFINLVIHDTGHGFGFWKEAVDAEIYGCLIYNCGTANSPGNYQTHGHGIYSQNDTGIKNIRDNIIFNQFGFGIHLYPNPGHVNGYVLDGNTLFNNGILTGSTVRYNNLLANTYPGYTVDNITVSNNNTFDSRASHNYTSVYEADVFLGATNVTCTDLNVTDNYFAGRGRAGIAALNWDTVVFTGNTTAYNANGTIGAALPLTSTAAAYTWNNNTYYGGSNALHFSYQYNVSTNFTTWQTQTGFDNSSTFQAGFPSGLHYVLQPNMYEQGRANLVIYNWDSLSSVTVDLAASGLVNGQAFTIADAQNYFGAPVYSGTYSSTNTLVNLNLTGLTAAAAYGMTALPHTSPLFAVLVILPGALPNTMQEQAIAKNTCRVYPNPANEKTAVFISLPEARIVQLSVQTLAGEIIREQNGFSLPAGKHELVLRTDYLAKGVYLLRIKAGDETFLQRLIIQ